MSTVLTEDQSNALANVDLAAWTMRPTFQLPVSMDADQLAERIRRSLEAKEFREHVKSKGRNVDFTIEPKNQRFWSPNLSVQLSRSESGTMIFGRFSARPEIWTMFFVVYEVMAVAAFGGAIYGYVQWALKSEPWALALTPVGVSVIVMLHVASLIGQHLSSDQIQILLERFKSVLEQALDDSVPS
jgi:hypothetical protein